MKKQTPPSDFHLDGGGKDQGRLFFRRGNGRSHVGGSNPVFLRIGWKSGCVVPKAWSCLMKFMMFGPFCA